MPALKEVLTAEWQHCIQFVYGDLLLKTLDLEKLSPCLFGTNSTSSSDTQIWTIRVEKVELHEGSVVSLLVVTKIKTQLRLYFAVSPSPEFHMNSHEVN